MVVRRGAGLGIVEGLIDVNCVTFIGSLVVERVTIVLYGRIVNGNKRTVGLIVKHGSGVRPINVRSIGSEVNACRLLAVDEAVFGYEILLAVKYEIFSLVGSVAVVVTEDSACAAESLPENLLERIHSGVAVILIGRVEVYGLHTHVSILKACDLMNVGSVVNTEDSYKVCLEGLGNVYLLKCLIFAVYVIERVCVFTVNGVVDKVYRNGGIISLVDLTDDLSAVGLDVTVGGDEYL